ncbi:MAG: hypothetical protein ABIG68_14390 [Acidobacteriota bacterium]
MKAKILGAVLAAACSLATGWAQTPITPQAALEKLKGLAGEWKGSVRGDESTPVTVSYRVTANNSVVIETMFAGAPHEMVTAYHMNGDQLMMTHYCSAGNQPQMVLDRHSGADRLIFNFAGGTNLNPAKDEHVHNLRIRWVNNGSIESEWDGYKDGKLAETTTFVLTRKK